MSPPKPAAARQAPQGGQGNLGAALRFLESHTPLISLQDASVVYAAGQVRALSHISLTLHQGERLALLGANGSGKTTLLRALNGLQALSHGQRLVHALPATQQPPVSAMLFQKPFFLSFSVQRNLRLGLWLRGVPADQRAQRADEALRRVGLRELAQRPAHALSGGQQQRLALARAWALQPDILFLDEPTASLDPSAKREVESLIAEFGQDGVSVVMSTHNLGQAKRLATQVAYLEAGQLVVQRPVDAFFNDTLPEAAAQFLKGELPWT